MGKDPLVFVVTETSNSRLLQNLFPDKVRDAHQISMIKYIEHHIVLNFAVYAQA